jgi:hypothetical protein
VIFFCGLWDAIECPNTHKRVGAKRDDCALSRHGLPVTYPFHMTV